MPPFDALLASNIKAEVDRHDLATKLQMDILSDNLYHKIRDTIGTCGATVQISNWKWSQERDGTGRHVTYSRTANIELLEE